MLSENKRISFCIDIIKKGGVYLTCLVIGSNHWIGFHIVNELLAQDIQVDGIEEKQGNELLSLYFGRNSSFSLVTDDVNKHYDTIIFSDKKQLLQHVQADRIFEIIGDEEQLKNATNSICIHPPILFGEWMPIKDGGVYDRQQWIGFDSAVLQTSGVYIEDFAKGLIQWMHTRQLPAELVVKSIRDKAHDKGKRGNTIYLRDHISVQENIKKVCDHYERYSALY